MKRYMSPASMDRLCAQQMQHTGAMIALVPTEEDAERLAVLDYEAAGELHVTLAFLGEADDWDDAARLQLRAAVAPAAQIPPIEGKLFARALFNPTVNPCAVYLVGGQEVAGMHGLVGHLLEESGLGWKLPEQHVPWVPHLAIGYGLDETRLNFGGLPVRFDRLRVAFAMENFDLPL